MAGTRPGRRELERPGLVQRVIDGRRDRRLAGDRGGAPTSLSGDELVAVADWPDAHRLQHATLTNRVRQRGQRRLIEALARLSRLP
jgi:hypothetical protein